MAYRARNGEIAKKFDNNGKKSKIRRIIMENRVNKNEIAESAVCKGIVIGTEDAERIMSCLESVSEASARVGVSKVAIYKRIKRGDLRCMRCYGVVIVEKGEVDALYNVGARKEGVE